MGGIGTGTWIRPERKRLIEACHPYDIKDYAEEKKLRDKIQVQKTPCRFGGERVWWICPGEGCGRKVTRLYRVNGALLCRKCHNLAYRSQLQQNPARMMDKVKRLRAQLGDSSAKLFNPITAKPAHMKQQTYDKIAAEIMQTEVRILTVVFSGMQRHDNGWRGDKVSNVTRLKNSQLTEEQRRVIELLLLGLTDAEVVQAVGISLEDLNAWRKHDALFIAELNCRRKALWDNSVDMLRVLIPLSLNTIREVLTDTSNPQRWRAAMEIVKLGGLSPEASHSLGTAIGEDDPARIRTD